LIALLPRGVSSDIWSRKTMPGVGTLPRGSQWLHPIAQ
jgi:hypothetical protein